MEVNEKARKLGYVADGQKEGHEIGFHRLDVVLTDDTDQPYFKIKEVGFLAVSKVKKESWKKYNPMTISRHWRGTKEYRVLPGTVTLVQENEDHIVFFTFGGSIKIQGGEHTTHCSLSSPVPIYHLEEKETLETLLVEEIECLLAIKHAKLGDKGYWSKLETIQPKNCYAACLESLLEKYEQMGNYQVRQTQDLVQYLKQKITDQEITHWSGSNDRD